MRRMSSICWTPLSSISSQPSTDGFASASKACYGNTGRYTSGMTDMNRNFPSHWYEGPQKNKDKETELVIKYADTVPAVLGLSFHDGALVANYPWDSMPGLSTSSYAASPDDSLFLRLAKTYSTNHAYMSETSRQCGVDNFKDGITNGNKWYKVYNGMQDWNYFLKDCFEVTVELGCCKYPADAKETFTDVWADNFESVFAFSKLVQYGIRGKVVDHNGNPMLGSTISVSDSGKPIKVRHKSGYYWRPLLAALYNVTASKAGYSSVTRRNIRVDENDSTEVSFVLIAKSQVRRSKQRRQE